MHDNQSIRICGHTLNWHKTIKPYTLVKMTLVLGFLSMPAHAAETSARYDLVSLTPAKQQQAPLATAHPQSVKAMDKSANGKANLRDQRSAGPSSLSPAMALAMAFGLRTAQGPMEHAQKAVSPSTKDARRMTGMDGRDALARHTKTTSRDLLKKENYSRVALE